jgi:hypothetical protein
MAQYHKIVARKGLASEIIALMEGEIGFDIDTKTFRVGDGTASPPKIITNKSTGSVDFSSLTEITFPTIKLKSGAKIAGVDLSSMLSAAGLIAARSDGNFSPVSILSSDNSLVVTHGDGQGGNIDIKLHPTIIDSILSANVLTFVSHDTSLVGLGNPSSPLSVVNSTVLNRGIIQTATQSEANSGIDDTKALTPANLLNISGNTLTSLQSKMTDAFLTVNPKTYTTLQKSQIKQNMGINKAVEISNWDNATELGLYSIIDGNGPSTQAGLGAPPGFYMGWSEPHSNTGFITQTVTFLSSDGASNTYTYRRSMDNGVWGLWYKLLMSETELDARYSSQLSQNDMDLRYAIVNNPLAPIPDFKQSHIRLWAQTGGNASYGIMDESGSVQKTNMRWNRTLNRFEQFHVDQSSNILSHSGADGLWRIAENVVRHAGNSDWVTLGVWTWTNNITQITFPNLAGYNEIEVQFEGLTLTTGGTPLIQLSTDNGVTFSSANYNSHACNDATGTPRSDGFVTKDGGIVTSTDQDKGMYRFNNFGVASQTHGGGVITNNFCSGYRSVSEINNALRYNGNGSTLTGGTIRVRGSR